MLRQAAESGRISERPALSVTNTPTYLVIQCGIPLWSKRAQTVAERSQVRCTEHNHRRPVLCPPALLLCSPTEQDDTMKISMSSFPSRALGRSAQGVCAHLDDVTAPRKDKSARGSHCLSLNAPMPSCRFLHTAVCYSSPHTAPWPSNARQVCVSQC